MASLVLRNTGWPWLSVERTLLLEGNPMSAGSRAVERLGADSTLTTDRRVELWMIAAVSQRLRSRAAEALDSAESARAMSRVSPPDLRCLAEANLVEIISSVSEERAPIVEAMRHLDQFRQTFAGDIDGSVACTLDAVLARAAYRVGHVVTAEDLLARIRHSNHSDAWIDAWALATHAQCELLNGESTAAMQAANSAAAAATMLGRAFGVSWIWAAIAEVAWQTSDQAKAWAWSSKAIDAAAVRPADSRSSFMPGNLVWGMGA